MLFTLTADQAQGLAARNPSVARGVYIGVVNGQWLVRLTGTVNLAEVDVLAHAGVDLRVSAQRRSEAFASGSPRLDRRTCSCRTPASQLVTQLG